MTPGIPVSIHTTTAQDLIGLGVTPHRARLVVQARDAETLDKWRSAGALLSIRGIGPVTVALL